MATERAPVETPVVGFPAIKAAFVGVAADHAEDTGTADAAQDVALVGMVQVSFEALPLTTDVGVAVRVKVGGGGIMETVTLFVVVPPGPEQARV